MKLNPTGIAFVFFLGALAALPPLSIDMALPASISITNALRTTPSLAGLTLSLFMAGFAVSPVVYGPLSDQFGRRSVLLAGLVLFTVGGVAATAAPSITVLLSARLLQGAGAGAGMTLAFAMVRDLFEGPTAQRRLAIITIVANVAPIVAPSFGAGLLTLSGWRSIYGTTALSGLLLTAIVAVCVDETGGPRVPAPGSLLSRLALDYRRLAMQDEVKAHVLANGLAFGWLFAYVSGSPLVLIGVLHVPAFLYAALFACTGAAIVLGAYINGRLTRHGVSFRKLLLLAILLAVLSTAALVAASCTGHLALAVITPLLVITTGWFGLAAPSATHGALDPVPELAGVVGGLLTSMQMLTGAVASIIVVLLFPYLGPVAMTATMGGFALAALAIYLPYILRHRGQSQNPRDI